MRPVTLFGLSNVRDPLVLSALQEIARASQENDTIVISQNFTITGAYTATRSLDVSTATLADLIAFVATLVSDLQKGGARREN